jgi:Lrp/AsnC family leucine-responsive transcriptional regulator
MRKKTPAWPIEWKRNAGMSSRSQRELDGLDWQLLRELQADARLSYNELARRTGLSSPTVAERVRRMEDAGVIAGYRAEVDPAKVGLPVMAVVHMRCDPGKCLLKTTGVEAYPEILEVLKVWGSHCTIFKVVAESNEHLAEIFERLGQHGQVETLIVWPSGHTRRLIDWEDEAPRTTP